MGVMQTLYWGRGGGPLYGAVTPQHARDRPIEPRSFTTASYPFREIVPNFHSVRVLNAHFLRICSLSLYLAMILLQYCRPLFF